MVMISDVTSSQILFYPLHIEVVCLSPLKTPSRTVLRSCTSTLKLMGPFINSLLKCFEARHFLLHRTDL